jgi:hypothetical protein
MFASGTLRRTAKIQDLLRVQESRREGGDTEPAREYTHLYGKGNVSMSMRWTGNIRRRQRREISIGYWCGNQKERDH